MGWDAYDPNVRYQVHRFEGYVDGKESWMKIGTKWTREAAETYADEWRKEQPKRRFRIRKIRRR